MRSFYVSISSLVTVLLTNMFPDFFLLTGEAVIFLFSNPYTWISVFVVTVLVQYWKICKLSKWKMIYDEFVQSLLSRRRSMVGNVTLSKILKCKDGTFHVIVSKNDIFTFFNYNKVSHHISSNAYTEFHLTPEEEKELLKKIDEYSLDMLLSDSIKCT